MAKNTFVMYKDRKDMLDVMSDQDVASFLRSIYKYQDSGEIGDMTPGAKIAFANAKKMFDKDKVVYEDICKERSKAGIEGNRKRWQKVANAIPASQTIPDNEYEYKNIRKKYISKDIYKERIIPIIDDYIKMGYKKEDLHEEAKTCRMHHQEKGGIKIASTTYTNRLKNQIKRGKISKAPKERVYLNDEE